MIITFGCYTLDVDVDKTREFYSRKRNYQCSCAGCRNFIKAVDSFPCELRDFFDKLGVDMKNATEVYYINSTTEHGVDYLFYGGFTHICGTLISGEDAFHVTDKFDVLFIKDCDLLEDDFPVSSGADKNVFQLEISAYIPWVLDEEMRGEIWR